MASCAIVNATSIVSTFSVGSPCAEARGIHKTEAAMHMTRQPNFISNLSFQRLLAGRCRPAFRAVFLERRCSQTQAHFSGLYSTFIRIRWQLNAGISFADLGTASPFSSERR